MATSAHQPFALDFAHRPQPTPRPPNPPLYSDPLAATTAAGAAAGGGGSRRAAGNLKHAQKSPSAEDVHRLRRAKAWELALAPAKQVPMQGFMLWMSGSGVQIFSVMAVYMLIKNAIAGALNVHKAFLPFEPPVVPVAPGSAPPPKPYDLTLQKLAFIACQGLLLGLGLWKVNGMGLLPTRTSDWFMYEERPPWAERPVWETSEF